MTTITRAVRFEFRGRRKRAIDPGRESELPTPQGRIPRVSRLMALAIRFDGLLRRGEVQDQSELARLCRVTQPRMTQIMNLLHLAPDLQQAILDLPLVTSGQDPVTERELRPICAEMSWARQRESWTRFTM